MQVRLEVTNGKSNVRRVLLERDAVIGRAKTCNLRVASNQVSREHCKLIMHPEGVIICDLGSSNGTIVNGEKIPAKQELMLETGSEIIIGPARFKIVFDAPVKPNGLPEPGSTVDAVPSVDLSTHVDAGDTVQAPVEEQEEIFPNFAEQEQAPETPNSVPSASEVAEADVGENEFELEEDLELDSPDDSVKLQEADLTAYETIPGRDAEPVSDDIPDFTGIEEVDVEIEPEIDIESEPVVEVEPVADVEPADQEEPILEAEIELEPMEEAEIELEAVEDVELEAEPVAPPEPKPAKKVKKIKKVKKKKEDEEPAPAQPAADADAAALGFLNEIEEENSPGEVDTGLGDFFSQFD